MAEVAGAASVRVAAIVLAAGESRRMGDANKLLLDVRGKPLVAHVVEQLLAVDAATIDRVIVVLGFEAEPVRAGLMARSAVGRACSEGRLTFVVNGGYAEGMASSIRAGVEAAGAVAGGVGAAGVGAGDAPVGGYLFCLADQPFIESAEYARIGRAFLESVAARPGAIVVPRHAGRRGNPVALSFVYRGEISALRGAKGCLPIVERHADAVEYVEMAEDHVLRDVDTAADLAGPMIPDNRA